MYKVKIASQYIICLLILSLHLQCNNAKDTNALSVSSNNNEVHKLTSTDIEKIKYTEYVLSDLAERKTKNWIKFQNLIDQIELLKKGDFSFLKKDKTMFQSFIDDLKNEIPGSLNTTEILVRLTVLETTLYKLNEVLNLQSVEKQSILSNIKDVLIAHNNLILQINKKVEKESQKIIKP